MAYPSNDGPSSVAGEELTQFIERIEHVEGEMAALATDKKEIYAELKARGYDGAVMRTIVARRKKNKDALAEFEAILDTYLAAIGDI